MTWQVDELVKFHRRTLLHEQGDARSLIDLLCDIYMSDNVNPRKKADEYFCSILNFEADCRIMKEDIQYGLIDKEREDT